MPSSQVLDFMPSSQVLLFHALLAGAQFHALLAGARFHALLAGVLFHALNSGAPPSIPGLALVVGGEKRISKPFCWHIAVLVPFNDLSD